MTLGADGDLLRSAHQVILEEEHARGTTACHHIVVIGRDVIVRGEFEEDTTLMTTLQTILTKVQHVLQY